jgi:hypothetical protein
MTDLAIAYRIYPRVSKVPALHDTDKFRLATFCLLSLREALQGLNFRLCAILDGCPPQYEELFRSTFRENELEIIQTDSVGNLSTFSMQIDLLLNQTDAEFVFFAEDDYFYFPKALAEMVEFARQNKDVDFVTPYDHPDSYSTGARHERHQLKTFGSRHWRTVSSTCLTFLARRSALQATERQMRTYSRGNMDCALWLALTQKLELANPAVHADNHISLKIWVKTWLWGWRFLFFSRRFRLWSPLPTLATHMERPCLAPLVDWQAEWGAAEARYSQKLQGKSMIG